MQQLDEPCDSRFDPDMAEDVMMAGLVYLLSMYDLYDVTIWITNPTMGFFFGLLGLLGIKIIFRHSGPLCSSHICNSTAVSSKHSLFDTFSAWKLLIYYYTFFHTRSLYIVILARKVS